MTTQDDIDHLANALAKRGLTEEDDAGIIACHVASIGWASPRRVTELLEANNRMVERTRALSWRLADLGQIANRAAAKFRELAHWYECVDKRGHGNDEDTVLVHLPNQVRLYDMADEIKDQTADVPPDTTACPARECGRFYDTTTRLWACRAADGCPGRP